MSGHVFDHGAERKLPLSTRFVAAILLVLVLACTGLWAALDSGVQAAPSREGLTASVAGDPSQRAIALSAARENVARVQTLFNRGADPHAIDGEEQLALSAAIRAGLDIDAKDAAGFTQLTLAALLSRTAVVGLLVARGADVRVKDAQGRTALQLAAATGNLECVRALLDAGADPRVADDRGWTALHEAASQGHGSVVQALASVLDRTGLDARTSRGATALHWAARHGESKCVRALLDAGASPAARDTDGRLARDLAPREGSEEAWIRLGPATPMPPVRRPDPVLLDNAKRRPAIYLCSRAAKALHGPLVNLDLAIWRDGAAVFAPWSADGSRDYVAGVLSPAAVRAVLLDLEEAGWLDSKPAPVDPDQRDCVELTVERRGAWTRMLWEEVEHLELDAASLARAAIVDWRLGRSKALDVLRSARPVTTQAISFVLIDGSFRGISFENGVHASWMD